VTHVDLVFPIRGITIPRDHGYLLYAALSRAAPTLHRVDWLAVHPIGGRPLGRDTLALSRTSSVTLRLPVARIGAALPLAGAALDVTGSRVVLGAPNIRVLSPAPSLDARLVIIKLTNMPEKADGTLDVDGLRERFEIEARRQLSDIGIERPLTIAGRQSLAVRGRRVIGFSVRVTDLEPEESIRLQIEGIGGKRAMGCGVFRPTRPKGTA
jgi:CRISPR-associated protein Cas6